MQTGNSNSVTSSLTVGWQSIHRHLDIREQRNVLVWWKKTNTGGFDWYFLPFFFFCNTVYSYVTIKSCKMLLLCVFSFCNNIKCDNKKPFVSCFSFYNFIYNQKLITESISHPGGTSSVCRTTKHGTYVQAHSSLSIRVGEQESNLLQ